MKSQTKAEIFEIAWIRRSRPSGNADLLVIYSRSKPVPPFECARSRNPKKEKQNIVIRIDIIMI